MGLKKLVMKRVIIKIMILFLMLMSVSFGADLKINLKNLERDLISKGYNGKDYEEPAYNVSYYTRKNGVYEENINIFSENSKVYEMDLNSKHYHASPNTNEIMENLEAIIKTVQKNSQNKELNKFLENCLKNIPKNEGITRFSAGKYTALIIVTNIERNIIVGEK